MKNTQKMRDIQWRKGIVKGKSYTFVQIWSIKKFQVCIKYLSFTPKFASDVNYRITKVKP